MTLTVGAALAQTASVGRDEILSLMPVRSTYGNLLNLWYVMGPIKVANPNYNNSADTEDENYEPEFRRVEDCLERIPNEGNKPVQNTLVTNKKFVQLLTRGMFDPGTMTITATFGGPRNSSLLCC